MVEGVAALLGGPAAREVMVKSERLTTVAVPEWEGLVV